MEKLLRHGIASGRKVLFSAKRLLFLTILLIWAVTTVACNLGTTYVSALDLTATVSALINQVPTTHPALATNEPIALAEPTPNLAQPTTSSIELPGTPLPTLLVEATPLPTATRDNTPRPPILYYTQSGDTLPVLAAHFGVEVDEIRAQGLVPDIGFITPGTLLIIPDYYGADLASDPVLPDSEIIYSPSALDFDISAYVKEANGYLSTYREYIVDRWYSGAEVVELMAMEESINPRLLLGLLEYQSHWVYGQPENLAAETYPMGFIVQEKQGLRKQLSLAVQELSSGYYGWREGRIIEVFFPDGSQQRIYPKINAGSAAIQQFFSHFYDPARWLGVLYGPDSFPVLYEQMFGSPWLRSQTVEPLFPTTLTQPVLELPFKVGKLWSYTGGPHPAWGPKGSWAAVDFAPGSDESGCVTSNEWVTASAPGLVVRTGTGIVVVDLDGDGYEQTGWVLFYLHIATKDKVKAGAYLEQDEEIGHPSCEGGSSTGTHVHIARKYNGEWITADGPVPFTLSGWVVGKGNKAYEGTLMRDGAIVTAHTYGSFETQIRRD
jgi:hypothetical protein